MLFFGCAKSDSSEQEVQKPSSSEVTIIIDNPDGLNTFFQWYSLFNIGMVNPYQSTKKIDTVVIESTLPVRIGSSQRIVSDDDKVEFRNESYTLSPGEIVHFRWRKDITPYFEILDNPSRNHELHFSIAFQKKMGNYQGYGVNLPFRNQKTSERLKNIKQVYSDRVAFLDEYTKEHKVSDVFYEQIKTDFYYKQYIDFLWFYQNKNELVGNKEVNEFIDEFKYNESIEPTENGSFALLAVTGFKAKKSADYKDLYTYAKENLTGTGRDVALYRILYNALAENSPHVSELVNDFLSTSTSPIIKNEVEKSMKLHVDMLEHQKSLAGDNTYLVKYPSMEKILWSDFLTKNKDKVIYADFWASWCGPCVVELPKSLKLISELKDKPVAFVFLSQDNSADQWEKAVKKYNLSGLDNVYLLGGGNHSNILKHFSIKSIPHYLIFDKNGNLANKNAPRPSDPKVKQIFDVLIGK